MKRQGEVTDMNFSLFSLSILRIETTLRIYPASQREQAGMLPLEYDGAGDEYARSNHRFRRGCRLGPNSRLYLVLATLLPAF